MPIRTYLPRHGVALPALQAIYLRLVGEGDWLWRYKELLPTNIRVGRRMQQHVIPFLFH